MSVGKINAPSTKVRWLLINESESWISIGLSLITIISIVTTIYLVLSIKPNLVQIDQLLHYIPLIILLAFLNAFSEEIIFRYSIVSSFSIIFTKETILLTSAIIFGVVHFGGTPGGFIGMGMAGILGFVLCKSVIETNGLFWAILIHWVQDILIISSVVLGKFKT